MRSRKGLPFSPNAYEALVVAKDCKVAQHRGQETDFGQGSRLLREDVSW